MDPALLRERAAFKKKALSTPAVESKKKEPTKDDKAKKWKQSSSSTKPDVFGFKSKNLAGTSQYKFSVLAKIVKHMRQRHQEGENHPLSLDDILDETNQLDVGLRVKNWLQQEALPSNPKITFEDGTYMFKPPYKVRNKKSMLHLLKQHDVKGLGGVLLEDVKESLPRCDKVLKLLDKDIIYVTRPVDKKQVLFYNDTTANFNVDDEFRKLWRAVPVDGIDDEKIDEYLDKQGIKSMQDEGFKRSVQQIKRKRPGGNRKKTFKKPRDNEHIANVLENYDE